MANLNPWQCEILEKFKFFYDTVKADVTLMFVCYDLNGQCGLRSEKRRWVEDIVSMRRRSRGSGRTPFNLQSAALLVVAVVNTNN